MKVEYKVRPVTRYVITEWADPELPNVEFSGGSKAMGEFDNYKIANSVCSAMARNTKEVPNDLTPEDRELKVFYTLYSPDHQLDDIKVEVI